MSTVGVVPGIRKLARRAAAGEPGRVAARRQRPRCATSWCRSTGATRSRRCSTPAPTYLAARRRRLSFEWALIDGVNDRDVDAERAGRPVPTRCRSPPTSTSSRSTRRRAGRRSGSPADAGAGLPRPASTTRRRERHRAPQPGHRHRRRLRPARRRPPGHALAARHASLKRRADPGNDAVSVDRDGSRRPLVALRARRGRADRGAAPRAGRSRPEPRLVPARLAAAAGPARRLRRVVAGRPRGDGRRRGGAAGHDAGHRPRAGGPDEAAVAVPGRRSSAWRSCAASSRGGTAARLYTVAYDLEYDLRTIVYGHLTRLSFAFYDRVQSGQLISRANSDIRSVQMFSPSPR